MKSIEAERMKSIEILLVEDNAGDTLLIGEALRESLTPINLHVARRRNGRPPRGHLAKPDLGHSGPEPAKPLGPSDAGKIPSERCAHRRV